MHARDAVVSVTFEPTSKQARLHLYTVVAPSHLLRFTRRGFPIIASCAQAQQHSPPGFIWWLLTWQFAVSTHITFISCMNGWISCCTHAHGHRTCVGNMATDTQQPATPYMPQVANRASNTITGWHFPT